ncbi:unnamed protein product [Haemonchus placei]|uniref:Secreted protein n=1 Tax=Haemonchus placei TaxID=6290 RepID=A0A158QL01_HAEPC|nr:unnamed protein product [Haemonchus placei]
MMLCLYIVLSFVGLCYKAGRAEESTDPSTVSKTPESAKIELPEVKRPEKTDQVFQAFPYTISEQFVTQTMSYKEGYRQDVPPYIAIYDAPSFDIFFYIFPPKQCDAVWLCFPKVVNISAQHVEQFYAFNVHSACKESLRFHPLEQMVYITGFNRKTAGQSTPKSGKYACPGYHLLGFILFILSAS